MTSTTFTLGDDVKVEITVTETGTGGLLFTLKVDESAGMTADLGTLQRLPTIVPQGVVRELAFTGRRLSAERALRVGLVNEVYPTSEDALEAGMEAAREVAALAPAAVWGTKEMLNYARDHSVPESLDYVATWQSGMFRPADVREALLARRKRRSPEFDDLPPIPEGP